MIAGKGTERQLSEEQVLSRLAGECSKAEHCSGEMIEKMRRWGVAGDVQQRVLDYLTDHKYIDDKRYARLFVRDKLQFNKWGPRKIEQALWMKHVKEDDYRAAIDEIGENEWETILLPLLRAKAKTTKADSDYERKMKLMKFAASRGFMMDTIQGVIDLI